MNNLRLLKSKQRKESLLRRKEIFNSNKTVNKYLINHLISSVLFKKSNIIASYFSVNYEMQTKYLNNELVKFGKILCLPAIEPENNLLSFRVLNNKTKMVKGKFKIMEPDKLSQKVNPDLILVPCVAFDKYGNRMGYGGGYYDRTINKLRFKFNNLKTIIVAFSKQEVKKIIIDENDQKLDYILTEKKLIKI